MGDAASGHPAARPERAEAAPYYARYIDLVPAGDIRDILDAQKGEALARFAGITEERSRYRYEPGKWSIRQVLNHVTDTERVFQARAFWFARSFDTPLPSFEQEIAAHAARGDEVSWARHVEEFGTVRDATLTLFRNFPDEAWSRAGIASGNPFTVRAVACVVAGHFLHHMAVLAERYG